MDRDTRELLIAMAEAIDAVLVALQVQAAGDTDAADYTVREAVHRANEFRRAIREMRTDPQYDP